MEISNTKIPGLLVIKPTIFKDPRGYFFESYNEEKLLNAGIDVRFVQDNESKSQKGVLRGLHFQNPPYSQGKLVRVIQGAVLDVAVDLRKESSTYGQWDSIVLSAENKLMYWVPEGMAHGFLTLKNDTIFFYKCTKAYNKEAEACIRWNDPELNIEWGTDKPILSDRDKVSPFLKELKLTFN